MSIFLKREKDIKVGAITKKCFFCGKKVDDVFVVSPNDYVMANTLVVCQDCYVNVFPESKKDVTNLSVSEPSVTERFSESFGCKVCLKCDDECSWCSANDDAFGREPSGVIDND